MRSLILCARCYLILACGMAATTVAALALGLDRLREAQLLLLPPAGALIICAAWMFACVKRISKTDTSESETLDAETRQRLAASYLSTIRSLVVAIDAKDSYTRAHTSRVEEVAETIARRMGLNAAEIEGIRTAALVHDIGKIGIPEHLLRKPGKLTAEEFQTIKEHPAIGSQILEPVEFPWPIKSMVRGHHEKWDGTGYPDGLSGNNIPLGARILAVADVYDAMTSNRSYRDRLSPDEALAHIVHLSGSHFDPAVVKALTAIAGKLSFVLPPPVDKPGTVDSAPEPIQENRNKSTLQTANRELLALSEVTRALGSSLNPQDMVSLLAGKIRAALDADTCTIFLKEDGDSTEMTAYGVCGVNDRFFNGATAQIGEGVTGTVMVTGQPYYGTYQKSDVTLTASTQQWVEFKSCLIVPISRGDSAVGSINMYMRSQEGFDNEDVSLLKMIASRTAGALERASIRMRSERLTPTDAVTGLLNAASFLESLHKHMFEPDRKPVSVLSLSLDNFKNVNETLGHHSGDRLLQSVARVLKDAVDDKSLVARYAGDTFVVALIDTDSAGVQKAAERIEECFNSYASVSHIPRMCKVGISIGIASCPDDGTTAKSLVAAAEARQHESKNQKKTAQEVAA